MTASLSLDLTVDTLTGASPSGAIASDQPQTFTSPSGRGTYTTPAGEIPLDSSFHDTRFALNASWSQPFARLYTFTAGLGISTEFDYQHLGLNAGLTRDFNERNTTLSFAVALGRTGETGRRCAASFAPCATRSTKSTTPESARTARGSSENKDVIDVLLGVTQVLGRHSLLRLNYSYSDSSGYLTDPYKILTVVDPLTGEPLMRTPPPGVEGPGGIYLFEHRPDSRARQGLYAELRQDFSGKVLRSGIAIRPTTGKSIRTHSRRGSAFRSASRAISSRTCATTRRRRLPSTATASPMARRCPNSPAPMRGSRTRRIYSRHQVRTPRRRGGNEWSARLELYHQIGKAPDQC